MLAENGRRDITQIIQKLEPEWSERILALKMNGMCSWKQIDICKAIQLLKLTIEDIPIVCTRVGHYSVLTG